VSNLPKETELFQSVRKEYATELTTIKTRSKDFCATVDWLLAALESKEKSLFESRELEGQATADGFDLEKITIPLKRHNALSTNLEKERQEAAARVEQTRVEEARSEYERLNREIDECTRQKSRVERQRRASKEELDRLSQDNFDPYPLAERLNSDLTQLLGRDDLRFVVEGNAYRIERNGSAAQHLSEGERNAISLLHFLCSLATHGTTASQCIVVIDDPVSSLDGNALAGASAHLWAELVGQGKCGQVFLLTHNFELFRMWSNQLDHSRDHIKQTCATFEMRTKVMRAKDGKFLRLPTIIPWPTDFNIRKRLRSEYHYLFWRASSELIGFRNDPTVAKEIEISTVLPNVCRRLLEGFLGFKAPAKMGNLHDQVMDTGGDSVSKSVRTRIYRFLQTYSHNQEADTTTPVGRPEATEILNAVLEFMKELDSDHFAAMCEAVDIDRAQLEAAVLPDVEDDQSSEGSDDGLFQLDSVDTGSGQTQF
jgi:wobble nucleotide-excising tRNase